jgi:hypothetical protein
MIELGQLRRWKEDLDVKGGDVVFIVVSHVGKFYPQGARRLALEDHWTIMAGGTIHSGWSSSLLEHHSEVVDETG